MREKDAQEQYEPTSLNYINIKKWVTGPNQVSLVVGHRTTAKVDDCFNTCYATWLSSNQNIDKTTSVTPFL
jgi:hypothetical protein